MSCCRMTSIDGSSAASNEDTFSGLSAVTSRMRAEMLSKVYWLKLGLLGFCMMTRRMAIRRFSTRSCTGTIALPVAMITRNTPAANQHGRSNGRRRAHAHFMR